MGNQLGEFRLKEPLPFGYKELLKVKGDPTMERYYPIHITDEDPEYIKKRNERTLNHDDERDGVEEMIYKNWVKSKYLQAGVYDRTNNKKVLELSRSTPDVQGYDTIRSDWSFPAILDRVELSSELKDAIFQVKPDLMPQTAMSVDEHGLKQSLQYPVNIDGWTGKRNDEFTVHPGQNLDFAGINPWRTESIALIYNPSTRKGVYVIDPHSDDESASKRIFDAYDQKARVNPLESVKAIAKEGTRLQAYLLGVNARSDDWKKEHFDKFVTDLKDIAKNNISIGEAKYMTLSEPEGQKPNFSVTEEGKVVGASVNPTMLPVVTITPSGKGEDPKGTSLMDKIFQKRK